MTGFDGWFRNHLTPLIKQNSVTRIESLCCQGGRHLRIMSENTKIVNIVTVKKKKWKQKKTCRPKLKTKEYKQRKKLQT